MIAKARRSLRPRRASRSHPVVVKWPRTNESVGDFYALMAVAFGNAPILARYLREAKTIHPDIIEMIAFMLDPTGSPATADAEGIRMSDWCKTWKLEFRRVGRGNQKNIGEISFSQLRIGAFIQKQITQGVKAEAAKQQAVEEFGISRAQANKVLGGFRWVKEHLAANPL